METGLIDTERGVIQRHLGLVSILLLLLIGPLFGPVTTFLGDRFGIETAVILLLLAFIISFTIILAVILRFKEMEGSSLREQLGRVGLGLAVNRQHAAIRAGDERRRDQPVQGGCGAAGGPGHGSGRPDHARLRDEWAAEDQGPRLGTASFVGAALRRLPHNMVL